MYSLHDPRHGLKAGAHQAGHAGRSRTTPASPTPRSSRHRSTGCARRFPDAAPDPVGADTCLYTTHRRRLVRPRAAREGRRRLCLLGPRLQVRAGDRGADRRARHGVTSRHAVLPAPRRRPAEAARAVPRQRHAPDRGGHGPRGLLGNESILYHLQSPCRVRSSATSTRSSGTSGCPDAHAHRHFSTYDVEPEGDPISGRKLLMWNNDVEISLVRPEGADGLLLPERRGRRGLLRPRGLRHARDDLRRPALQARRLHRAPARHDLPLRSGLAARASPRSSRRRA